MPQSSVIIVGGGVMGLSTGYALAQRNIRVTLLERQTIGHSWASSHGLSRVIRHEYGPHAIYTQMAARSLALWEALERSSGQHLYTETGILQLGWEDDGETLAGLAVMHAEHLPAVRLSSQECTARFPQFVPDPFTAITYNPRGGMLHVSECLSALVAGIRSHGGEIFELAHVRTVDASQGRGRVTLADGTQLSADRVVVTPGPWIHDVLPDLRLPVRVLRQQVLYFAGLSAAQFGVGAFPVFLTPAFHTPEVYGLPLQGPAWWKIAAGGTSETDPNVPYPPDDSNIAAVRDYMARVIPASTAGTLALVDRCMIDMTPDADYILDAHPAYPEVILGSGFSGHGFKMGILIGRLLADLALNEAPEMPLDTFRVARFTGERH